MLKHDIVKKKRKNAGWLLKIQEKEIGNERIHGRMRKDFGAKIGQNLVKN